MAKRGSRKKSASKKTTKKSTRSASPAVKSEMPLTRTCGTDRVHERLLMEVANYANARSAVENHYFRTCHAPRAARSGCTEIPVVVHVVYKTAAQNISDAQIESQIEALTADFRKKNADASNTPAPFAGLVSDARISFALATTDPNGDPTTGIVRTQTTKDAFFDDDAVKFAAQGGSDAWPRDTYLNIWVCQLGGGLLGYAQFPGGPAATDGVVILHSAFGTTGTAQAPFDKGRTTTHEVGHWLNLRHIWGDDGSGCSGSDFVDDTPNQGGPNYGVPAYPRVSCSNGPNGDLFMNYMDYVDDEAMVMFTAGQVMRMQAALDGARSTVGIAKPCVEVTPTLASEDIQTIAAIDVLETLPNLDPTATLAQEDIQPTLASADKPPTISWLDSPATLAWFDNLPTSPRDDTPQTWPWLDASGGSFKFIDDPKFKFTDDPKLPVSDMGGFNVPGGFPQSARPPMGGGGVPFILSTPHHSNAWVNSFPQMAQQRSSELIQQMTAMTQWLQQAAEAHAAGRLTPGEAQMAEQVHQQLLRLQAEYAAMTGGA